MTTATAEKVLLSENEERREQILEAAQKMLTALQRPFMAFKQHFNVSLPLSDIWDHAGDSSNVALLVRLLLYERNEELKKLPIPKHKALEFVDLPTGYFAYIDGLQLLKNFQERVASHLERKTDLSFFSVTDAGVQLNDLFYKDLESKTRSYASPQQIELLQELEGIFSQLQSIKERYPTLKLTATFDRDQASNPVFWTGVPSGRLYLNKRAIRDMRE
jgi:hypothetical protein